MIHIVKSPRVGPTYVVRAYFAKSGRTEHVMRPTLKDARRTMRAYLTDTSATTVTILKPIEYARKD